MRRVSGCLWLIVGIILAVSAGGVAYVTLQRAAAASSSATAVVAAVDVVVAARAVPVAGILQEADVTVVSWPAAGVPANALRATTDAIGLVTTIAVEPGEPLLRNHLTKADMRSGNLGFTLPAGKLGVTLPAGDLASKVELVQPNDRVDLHYTQQIDAAQSDASSSSSGGAMAQQYTFGTLQNVQVVGVIRGAVSKETSTGLTADTTKELGGGISAYILALDPQDALLLKYLRDAGATMDLALRNIRDEAEHVTTPVDQSYVLDKYRLQVH